MPYIFNSNPTFTLGVELELQLVDVESLALVPAFGRIAERVPPKWKNDFKPEFMQSYCEVNTGICRTVAEVKADLSEKLAWANEVAESMGIRIAWAGSHPFSRWDEQHVSVGERYQWLLNNMQDVARRLLTFGLHVHVGVDGGDKAIQMCDRLYRHLPTLLALSGNSPFWCGRDTGLASYRSKILEALPTAGLPESMRNWSEYVWLIDHLVATGFISSIRECWWDVRPHAEFGTVEVRVMDMPMSLNHTLGFVALTQSLVASISEQIDRGAYLFDCHPMIAKQNKWQAARHGMAAKFVDPGTMQAVPATVMVRGLVERLRPWAERLECVGELSFIDDIVVNGTGAARQREVFKRTGDLKDVVRLLIDQPAVGVV